MLQRENEDRREDSDVEEAFEGYGSRGKQALFHIYICTNI